MAKKKVKKAKIKRPSLFIVFKARMHREGKMKEFNERYRFHKDFGASHVQAMWDALREFGYKSAAEENEYWDKHEEMGADGYQREQQEILTKKEQEETSLRELMASSEGQKFDAVAGLEWVAANFHHKFVSASECPHIIAWNVLITSKKYEVAFFKDFLMKALQKGITTESTDKYSEDDSQMDDLRSAIEKAIK